VKFIIQKKDLPTRSHHKPSTSFSGVIADNISFLYVDNFSGSGS
jgi:hypothetical protein